MTQNSAAKVVLSFIILFMIYHAAEYMIVFKNDITGFFVFQLIFFVFAYLFGNWYNNGGLSSWGLPFNRRNIKFILTGILMGILIYAIPYFFTIVTKIEIITKFPTWQTAIKQSLPFAFGVIFSSFSEDILTRGLPYSHLNTRIKPFWLILLSAIIYLLNHIYRLNDGLESLLYIFLLGIIFIIPVLFTKNLWLTGSMHWAGNTFFYVTHNIIQTENKNPHISSNYIFAIFLFLTIPIIWQLSKKLKKA